MLSSVAASVGPNMPKSNAVTPTSDNALMSPTIVGRAAGEQLALAVDRALRLRLRVRRHAIGQSDVRRIAPGLLGHAAQLGDAGLEAASACPSGIAGWCRSDTRRRRSSRCAASPDRSRRRSRSGSAVCTGLGGNSTSENFTYLPSNFGVIGGPQLLAHHHPFVGHVAAVVERRRADRLEFLLAPAGADAQRQAALRQIVERRQDLRGQHRRAMRHHHHRRDDAQLRGCGGDEGRRRSIAPAAARRRRTGIRPIRNRDSATRWWSGSSRGR